MSWRALVRAMEVAARQGLREAQKREREAERRAREQANLSAIEQARLEVETHENQLEVLLSIHKQQGEAWDWPGLVASLSPPCPERHSHHEFKVRQQLSVSPEQGDSHAAIDFARSQDEQEYQEALTAYEEAKSEWEKMRSLARRVLAGELKAYSEALVELNPFDEISHLGSSLRYTVHSADLLEFRLKVNGRQAIPSDVKTLTASGRVSVKPMSKARFHEIYQDYVCGCVLRVAREVFALLPANTVLVTASASELDPRTGQTVEQQVLSVAMHRADIDHLDFDRLDPSDAMDNFLHRGEAKASRKSGVFETITPLTPSDLPSRSVRSSSVSGNRSGKKRKPGANTSVRCATLRRNRKCSARPWRWPSSACSRPRPSRRRSTSGNSRNSLRS